MAAGLAELGRACQLNRRASGAAATPRGLSIAKMLWHTNARYYAF
jgi:hypothetical protein